MRFSTCLAVLLLSSSAFGQRQRTAALSLVVSPECALAGVQQASSTLPQNPSTPASNKGQTYTFSYRVRTSPTGQGQIVARFSNASTKDFPNGSKIDYQSQFAGPIRGKSGTVTTQSAIANGIVVGDFGGEAHTGRSGSAGSFTMTLNPAPAGPFSVLTPTLGISCR